MSSDRRYFVIFKPVAALGNSQRVLTHTHTRTHESDYHRSEISLTTGRYSMPNGINARVISNDGTKPIEAGGSKMCKVDNARSLVRSRMREYIAFGMHNTSDE